MNKKSFAILSIIAFCCVFSIAIFCVFIGECFHIIDLYIELYPQVNFFIVFKYAIICLFCIFILAMCILQVFFILRKTNFFNFTRLTYEQYKEKRLQNQADKKQAKIEKLKRKLTEIEKD